MTVLIAAISVSFAGVFLGFRLLAGESGDSALNKAALSPRTPYIVVGMGCFWGAEKRMGAVPGVLDVEAGYSGGDAQQPHYETLHDTEKAIRQGQAIKNHAEAVKVYFDPEKTTLEQVLIKFWENHNPTQGDRQGADVGTNYRSAIFYRTDAERQLAEKTRAFYQSSLRNAGIAAAITTEISPLKYFTPAEEYHQDYLVKNPWGYCGLGGLGIAYHDSGTPMSGASGTAEQATADAANSAQNWQQVKLDVEQQLIVFGSAECGYCKQFDKEVLTNWTRPIAIVETYLKTPPDGWTLSEELVGTPTIVLFRRQQEVARYTGYHGAQRFWTWLNSETGGDRPRRSIHQASNEREIDRRPSP
jgi:peptide methionine sulfoxide reductase msrA/msrB